MTQDELNLRSRNADVSPRFEAIAQQDLYVGIWFYQDAEGQFFAVETSKLKNVGFLEDGTARRLSEGGTTTYFETFDEAFKAYCAKQIEGYDASSDEV